MDIQRLKRDLRLDVIAFALWPNRSSDLLPPRKTSLALLTSSRNPILCVRTMPASGRTEHFWT